VSEPISILDVIKRGGYEASLISTFNATLPFYEEVVLRKLVGAGCRHNVVLMDRSQCAISWGSEATRPRLAGHAYTLLPISAPGAFHPKLCIIVGPKKASILIGSHNLTLSGFGYNREVTNWIEVAGPKDAEGAALLADAWRMASQWIEMERGKSADALIDSTLALSNFISPLLANAIESTSAFALTQVPNGQPLIDQLSEKITKNVKRIGVIGAFFDNELAFVNEIAKRWPSAEIVVGIDPDSVQLAAIPKKGFARYVDARQLWQNSQSYLHAKAFYFEAGGGYSAFVSGSANPSRPAWMKTSSCNVEAVLLRIGGDAKEAAVVTGLNRIFGLAELDPKIFKSISLRSTAEIASSELIPVTLWTGTADGESGVIRIISPGRKTNIDRAVFFGSDMQILGEMACTPAIGVDLTLKPDNDVDSIRSCSFYKHDALVARAMIHHPDVISASSQSSRQYQIRSALSALGSSDGDISKVIASVERVIFADETNKEIDAALREHKEKQSGKAPASGPATLAISVTDMPREKKNLRLLKSGDLAYLLDVLMRRLSEGLGGAPIETDPSGRTEEEQIGQEGDDEISTTEPATSLSDFEIAIAVSRRARSLIRKMIAQLDLASTQETRKSSAVLQLTAVIALLRELRHLDKTPRWKRSGQLLVEEDDRRFLLDESLKYLLSSGTRMLDSMEHAVGSDTEETIQLRVLLLWLAWDLGEELTDQIGRFLDADELKSKLYTNAMFLKLLPPIANNNSALNELWESILRTNRQAPEATLRAQKWLTRHAKYGLEWTKGFDTDGYIHVGGYCYVPGKVDEPHVVIEASDRIVGFWDFDRIRQFERDRVIGVRPLVTFAA
jgi:hypothetical protein